MKEITKLLLDDAYEYSEKEDKSTEFMIDYMMSIAKVNLDCVINYLEKYQDFNTKPDITEEQQK